MRLIVHATDTEYRRVIRNPLAHGRLPHAWLTFGYVRGAGWGFVHPWAQIALFPGKGTLRPINPHGFTDKGGARKVRDPERDHDTFFLLRLLPTWRSEQHRNHETPIEGRYWWGLAWRRRWRWPRWVLLDPDKARDPVPVGSYRGDDCD
jgi:hypothetical protein